MPVEAMMCVEFRQPRLRGSKFSPSPARSVGEGARRADEGSLFKLNQYVRFILLRKSSSPECRQTGRALTRPSATLSHCFATGEGEALGVKPIASIFPGQSCPCGGRSREGPDGG